MKNENRSKKPLNFLMLCFFFVTACLGSYAQQAVSGTAIDESGLFLPALSVTIKGANTGAVTGTDGDFSTLVGDHLKMFRVRTRCLAG